MYKHLNRIGFVFIFLLVACNHTDQPSLNEKFMENSSEKERFIPLSTEDSQREGKEENQSKNNAPNNITNSQDESKDLGYGIPQEPPSQQQDLQKLTDTDSEQKTHVVQLPFQDFKERWNAISNEQGSNLIISSFERVTEEGGTFYRAPFQNRTELRVFTKNQNVQRLQIIGEGRTHADVLSMLTGWSQVFYMLNPAFAPHHIDTLFHELGVAPNANLEDVKENTLTHQGIQYKVIPTDTGYMFEASYPND
jgi:hypothetical protein